MLHADITSRPFTTQCQIQWPRPGEDFIHDRGTFQKTTGRRSFYVIHPDWLSEEFNPPKPRGRARLPWPWEFPGARSTYASTEQRLRNRILSDSAIESEKRRLTDFDKAYHVKHNSPWDVNNPDLNPHSNPLYKRDPAQSHTLPHNNARRVLNLELRHPPMNQRFRNGDLSRSLDHSELPDFRSRYASGRGRVPGMKPEDAATLRYLSGSYSTHCDWL